MVIAAFSLRCRSRSWVIVSGRIRGTSPERTSTFANFASCSRPHWIACPVPFCSACRTNCTPVFATASRTRSASCPMMTKILSGDTTFAAAAMTCASSGRPPTSCSTLGRLDFRRVPLPAAMMAIAKSEDGAKEDCLRGLILGGYLKSNGGQRFLRTVNDNAMKFLGETARVVTDDIALVDKVAGDAFHTQRLDGFLVYLDGGGAFLGIPGLQLIRNLSRVNERV